METVFILKREEIPHFSKHIISKEYGLFAPVKGEFKHSFKKINGEQVEEISLDFVRTTMPPLKALLTPPRENLFRIKDG
ncbi:MAG: hypothetical protein QW385_01490, partial [Thermoproteota archaeon]